MKLLLPILLFIHLGLEKERQDSQVYICVSKTSCAYHKTKNGCKGILACTHKIIKVSKSDAIHKYKYRACKICFGTDK